MKLTIALTFATANATIHRAARADDNWVENEFPQLGLTTRRSIFDSFEMRQSLDAAILRKYKHMENMIQFYDQSLNNITKYWTYGCWCFQMGDYPLRLGNGAPVDGVDKHCKKQKECYRCAKKDAQDAGRDKACLPEETKYKFKAQFDQVTGAPFVECTNKMGSCARNICECDKAFAEKLPAASNDPEEGWTEAHHAHYGGFDARNKCLRSLGGPKGDQKAVCCGSFPNRYMYRVNKDGSGQQCCGGNIYDTDTHQCCDESVVTNGSC